MNRRNVLVGLGTIVAGGGAALGSGAFSTVEASRSVNVGVADDSDALVGLDASVSDYATTTDGLLELDISNLNIDGTTTINGAFEIVNNTDESITVGFKDGSLSNTVTESNNNIEVTLTLASSGELSNNEDTVAVDLTIETTGASSSDSFNSDVTIMAEPTSP